MSYYSSNNCVDLRHLIIDEMTWFNSRNITNISKMIVLN